MKKGVPRKTGCYIFGGIDGFVGELSPNEAIILSFLPMKWKYIARDKDRTLYIYTSKPVKDPYHEEWINYKGEELIFPYTNLFKTIKWSDNRPINIDSLISGSI